MFLNLHYRFTDALTRKLESTKPLIPTMQVPMCVPISDKNTRGQVELKSSRLFESKEKINNAEVV